MTWKTRKMARRHIQNQKARINRNFKGYMLLGGIAISLAMVAVMINSNRSPLHTSLTNVQKGRRRSHYIIPYQMCAMKIGKNGTRLPLSTPLYG